MLISSELARVQSDNDNADALHVNQKWVPVQIILWGILYLYLVDPSNYFL